MSAQSAPMSFNQRFGILFDMGTAISITFFPTIRNIWQNPSLLVRPASLQKAIMANIWANGFGEGVNEGAQVVKETLITPNAFGIVLDVGAGHGHTLRFLDPSKVTKYIAVEPNTKMHSSIRAEGEKHAIPVEILACGIEELDASVLQVDTVVCVLTLCSVHDLEKCVSILYGLLKPDQGSVLLAYEHVKSKDATAVWWQKFWNPIWGGLFDNCRLDVASLDLMKSAFPWKQATVGMREGDHVCDLFVHETGLFVRA